MGRQQPLETSGSGVRIYFLQTRAYVHAHAITCKCACMCVCVHLENGGGVLSTFVNHSSPCRVVCVCICVCVFWVRVSHWTWSSTILWDWLTNELQELPVSAPYHHCWGNRCAPPHSALYLSAQCLKSCFYGTSTSQMSCLHSPNFCIHTL